MEGGRGSLDFNELLSSLDSLRKSQSTSTNTSRSNLALGRQGTSAGSRESRDALTPGCRPLSTISNATEVGAAGAEQAAFPQRTTSRKPTSSGTPRPTRIILNTTGGSVEERRRNRGNGQGARLCAQTSYGGRMNFTLTEGVATIGRKDGNTIVLADPKVSKEHCVIQYEGGIGYAIKDLRSANGVKVNDILLPPDSFHPLMDGDSLVIGSVVLVFYDAMAKAPRGGLGGVRRPSAQASAGNAATPITASESTVSLVTILPADTTYDGTISIQGEVERLETDHFPKASEITDVASMRADYEKLRLVYELSRRPATDSLQDLCAAALDLLFDILPFERGVVMLHDKATGVLGEIAVRRRPGKRIPGEEGGGQGEDPILLSSTIVNRVIKSGKGLVTLDAIEDPSLGMSDSVRRGQIRSAICMPLVSHMNFYGILHVDSKSRMGKFSSKDIALFQTIANQTAMAIENADLLVEVEAKTRITEQLSRFLPPNVVEKMNRSELIKTGGKTTTGTIVFADIRGFTSLSERSTPMEVVNLLNDFFERLVKIVFKWDGVVDKFIGDALMAVFGTLEGEGDAEYRATAAAMEFKRALQDMNAERSRSGKEAISIGVGVNTGVLLAGFIGSAQRLEYTCIGDTVNTSSRICSMAEGDQVLISESTYLAVRERVHVVPVGLRQFKGKETEVMVYEARALRDAPGAPSKLQFQNGQTLRR